MKLQREFILIDRQALKRSWEIIIPFHVAFMILGIFPIIDKMKSINLLYGLLLNCGYQLLLILLICFLLKDYLQQSWSAFMGERIGRRIKDILVGFLLCFALYVAFRLVITVCSMLLLQGESHNQVNLNEYAASFPILFCFLSVVVGTFTEECIYRGIIFQTLRKYSRVLACLGSGLLFGMMHMLSTFADGELGIAQIIVLMLTYAIGGIAEAVVQERYRNIWVNYFVHFIWNTIGALQIFM